MRIEQLNEGVIKVPPKLLNKSVERLLQVISTTIIRNIKRGEYLSGSNVDIYSKLNVEFKDYGDSFNVLSGEGMRPSFKFTVNELDFPYGKNDRFVTINLQFDGYMDDNNGFYQPVNDDKGTVVISVNDIINAAKFAIQIDDFYDDDSDMQLNLRDGIFPMDFNTSLLSLVKKAIGTIEHEMAHAIQFLIIKHSDQKKVNKGYLDQGVSDEYWKSPVEFSPQIISAARNIEAYIESLSIVMPSQRLKIFMYAIGEKSFDSLALSTNHSIELLNGSRTFFSTLKDKKPKAFKKAVKLLYDELDRKGVLSGRDMNESTYNDALSRYIQNPLYKLSNDKMDELLAAYSNDESTTIFRGLNFNTKNDYDAFISEIQDGVLETSSITSWSRDKEEALNFAITKPTFEITSDLADETDKAKNSGEVLIGYKGILLKTTIKKGVGVDTSKANVAAEDEIILPVGKYKIGYEVIDKFSTMMTDVNIDELIIKSLEKDSLSHSYVERFAEYVLQKFPHKLSVDTIERLINSYGGINLDKTNIKLVDINDPYFKKALKVNFNPWLFVFYDKGLLPSEMVNEVKRKGQEILSYVSSLLKPHGEVSLKSTGIKQLSDIIDDGTSYENMLKSTINATDTKHINSLKGDEKKKAISKERERILSMISDIE